MTEILDILVRFQGGFTPFSLEHLRGGSLRLGGEEIPVTEGDYVALPANVEGAHQLVNSSEAVLRYLCFSTMLEPDVMVYPDSGKVGIFGGAAPGGAKEQRTFSKFLREDAEVGYYDGEG